MKWNMNLNVKNLETNEKKKYGMLIFGRISVHISI